jgi:hypothetical protein
MATRTGTHSTESTPESTPETTERKRYSKGTSVNRVTLAGLWGARTGFRRRVVPRSRNEQALAMWMHAVFSDQRGDTSGTTSTVRRRGRRVKGVALN